MVRMGPRMGPTMGPQLAPNAVGDEDPTGPSQTFTAEPGDNFIYVATSGYLSGTGPFRLTTTGTLPAGLSRGVDYWTIVTNGTAPGDTFKLALSEALALAGTEVAITDTGSGVHTIVYVGDDPLVGFSEDFNSTNFEDYLEFSIDLDVVPVASGDGPFRVTTTGTPPAGYATDTNYWFIKQSSGTGWLAASESDALLGIAIPLTDGGTGTQTLTYVG